MIAIIAGVFLIMLIREIKAEYAIFSVVILGVFILIQSIPAISEILNVSKEMISSALDDSNISVLYKALGVSFLCQYVSDICKECGMESVSSKTELFGKIYLTLLCIPLLENILDTITVL